MQLHPHEQIIWRGHSSWKALYPFYLRWVLISLAPLTIAILLAIFTSVDISFWAQLLTLTILALGLIGIATAIKRYYSIYTLSDSRINIERGILGKKSQNCRIERIQNANCDQSLLERILNVGDVEFFTAGTSEAEADFAFHAINKPHELIARIDSLYEESTGPQKPGETAYDQD